MLCLIFPPHNFVGVVTAEESLSSTWSPYCVTSITNQLKYVSTIRWRRGFFIAEKQKIDNWKVEIILFFIDFIVKLSICVNIEEKIKVRSSPSSISCTLNFKSTEIYEIQVLTEIWVIKWNDIIIIFEIKEFCKVVFFLSLRRFCINSASYKFKKKSSWRGAQLEPDEIPTVFWNINPTYSTNIASIKSLSFWSFRLQCIPWQNRCFSLQNKNYHNPKQEIYIYDSHFYRQSSV